jgi:regulator of protease activity HflC (stomatin/prohibitin superfamily)
MKDKESLLPHELSGTPYRITSLAAAPVDVTYWVATGNLNGEVRLWKPSDGTFLEIKEHGDAVTSLAYSPNGKVIATGSADSKVRLFHTADGKRIDRDNQTHQGKITDLVFSPDGKTLASLGLDNTVCLWQFTDASVLTPTKLISIPLSAKNPLKMAFSQDSKSIATAGYDAVIRVWNVEDGLPIAEAPARAQPVIALGINNDGWIVAASLINSSRSIQEWSSPMQLSEMRDPRSGFALTRLFVGNEYSQLFWAAFLGIAGVGSVILFLVAAYSAVAARTLYSQYKNFTFWEGWRAAISIELGLHKILQIVTKGEVQTTPAVGPLARFGGPGVLIVEEGHAAVLMASGRITRVVGNGITWLKPFERVQTAVYLPARMEKVVVKDVSTQDKMVLSEFSLLVFYKVDPGNRSQHSGQYDFDPDLIKEKIWSPSGGDHNRAVKSISENIVRDLVGQYNLEDIAAISGEARQTLIKDIVDHINIKTKGFLGIDVGGADLGAVVLSSSAKQALEEKMLAEVRRQTAVINAEAEREKMVREAEGTALKTRLVEQERAAIREHFIKQLREPLQSPTGEPLVSEETAQRYIGILVRFLDMFEAVLGPDELDRLFSIRGRSKS